MTDTQVNIAIVGAGPYGLSLGADLQAEGIDYRVFGKPMQTWRTAMPLGMFLKSDGFASNLSDPEDRFTLAHYCAEEDLPYANLGLPVPVETFIAYGMAFQQRFVKDIDERLVIAIRRAPLGFVLELTDGAKIEASRLVLAVGITYFTHVPKELSGLPPDLCSHSSQHTELDEFGGSRIAIVGGGSSALDLAALLHRTGADVEVIARRDEVRFHSAMQLPRPLVDKILRPTSGLGPGWWSRFYTDAAPLFHRLPEEYRINAVRNSFGPAGGWFTRDDVIGKVPIQTSTSVIHAEREGDRVQLKLRRANGAMSELSCDHVIAATGYRADLGRVTILDPELSAKITIAERTPVLSAYFESSISGLYFVGPIAANSFGPMMRFAYGSQFVARRLTRHLAKTGHR